MDALSGFKVMMLDWASEYLGEFRVAIDRHDEARDNSASSELLHLPDWMVV